MVEMRDDGPEAYSINEQADRSLYRSVYLPLLRGVIPRSLEAFDPVTQTLVTGQREATTVATQALFMLNASFVRRQSLALAERLLSDRTESAVSRVRRAYQLTLGRVPNHQEVARAERFLAEYEASYRKLPPAETLPVKPVAAPDLPVDQDDERGSVVVLEETVQPQNSKAAAWMGFVQALYASADFRFVF
jgi:hypothetical protein